MQLDQLSNDILLHILSFMPTRHAARTCILSRRWRHLWKSLPRLDLDDCDFPAGTPPAALAWFLSDMASAERGDRPLLQSIRVSWRQELPDDQLVTSCLTAALARGLEELDLDLCTADISRLHAIFHAPSLVVLRLRSLPSLELNLRVRDTLRLDRLRTLHLSGVFSRKLPPQYQSRFNETLDEVVAACPVLEDLCLLECSFGTLNISAPKLVKLAVLCPPRRCVIRVRAPALQYFHFDRYEKQRFYVEGQSGVVDASVRMRGPFPGDTRLQLGPLADALGAAIRNVRSLTLIFKSAAELPQEEYPTFHNLRTLQIGTCLKHDTARAIAFLVVHSPRLETLEVQHKLGHRVEEPSSSICYCHFTNDEIKCSAGQVTAVDKFVELLRANYGAFGDTGYLSLIK